MITPFTSAHVARIAHLQPDGWDDIAAFFRYYVEAPFCLPLKIEDKERVVAIGSLILHVRIGRMISGVGPDRARGWVLIRSVGARPR